ARQQAAILDFGQLALSGYATEELGRDAIEMLTVHLGVPIAELHVYEAAEKRFCLQSSNGWRECEALRREIGKQSQVSTLVTTGQPIVSDDVWADPRFTDRAGFEQRGVRAGLCTLIGTSQIPLGALSVYGIESRLFTPSEVRFVESIGTILGEAMRWNAQNKRISEILESITDAFIAFDHNLRVTYVNERMALFVGYIREELIGKELREVFTHAREAQYYERYEHVITTRKVATYELFYPPDRRWYEASVYPAIDGVVAYFRDVTERKAAEVQLHQLNAELEHRVEERTVQLEHANKELESFAYSVSHDLRAPLRAIDGFSQALEEDYAAVLDASAQGYLGRVRKAAQRMADLIDALLKLARVARMQMSYARIDLSALAQSVAADLREADPARSVTFEIEPELSACGEPMLLRAVIENLLNNAWKFTKNKPDACIRVGQEAGELFVADNGAGFDMTYANKLFGAFQRLHGNEEFEGTGIGLATVARVIHRHGGDIRAHGEAGVGATFYFTLPNEEPRG
ncbi:MAG: ATP-binding protein, partial [Candidatus Eremiobacteraeota bacterium]|nr:ATP-binding protein [Candidatus Eremiobacteraeota bacterium]